MMTLSDIYLYNSLFLVVMYFCFVFLVSYMIVCRRLLKISSTLLSSLAIYLVKYIYEYEYKYECPLFCSHGKLIRLFPSMEFLTTYLIAMPRYEEMIAGSTKYIIAIVMASNIIEGL